MAATYSKPTVYPEWGATAASKSEPSTAQKNAGSIYQGEANSAFHNWRTDLTDDWIKWLGERFFDGADSGGQPEDFMIKVPGESLQYVLAWDYTLDAVLFEKDVLASTSGSASLGTATYDWEDVYTKNLFVENSAQIACRLDTAITNLAYNTARSILPSNSDTTTATTYLTTNASRQFTLATGQPSGRYEITYNVRLANAASNMEVSFRPVVNGTPLSADYSIILTSIIASAAYGPAQTISWLISLDADDDFEIEATQLDSGADSAILIGSHAVMKLSRPAYT